MTPTLDEILALDPIGPAPDGGDLVVRVPCRTRKGGGAWWHEATIHADWSVTTPHDLETERIGVAMGGYLSCLDLVDHDVPAVRDMAQRWARRIPPTVTAADDGTWRLGERACSKCRRSWPDADTAADHSRSWEHLLYKRPTTAPRVTQLISLMDEAYLGILDWAYDDCPGPDPHLTIEKEGMAWLWKCGLHPIMVRRIHDAVVPGGPALPIAFYVDVVAHRPDLGWLADTLPGNLDTGVPRWLASTYSDADAAAPWLRRELLHMGLDRSTIMALTEAGQSAAVVTGVADLTGRPAWTAGRLLAGWAKAGCVIDSDDVALLDELGADDRFYPPPAAVDALERLAGALHACMSRRQLGMVLAVAGNLTAAKHLLHNGIRDTAAARRYLDEHS